MQKDDLISRQDAIEAIAQYLSRFNLDRDYKQWKGTAKIILDHVLSAQPEPCEDAEFWRKRTEFYSKMCFDLIADMNKGVKIDSVEINEDGIKFTKKQQESCEDAVSRQRLLSDLKELVVAWKKYPVMAEQIKGVETAIGYVEAIPSVKSDSKELSSTHKALDTISRQAAIDAMGKAEWAKERLRELPSAQPELAKNSPILARKFGELIDSIEEERFPVDSDYAEGFMAAIDKVEWILKAWLPSAQPEPNFAQERYEDLCEYFKDCSDQGKSILTDRKEFKAWLDRGKWHVMKCDELGRELEKLKSAQPEYRLNEWCHDCKEYDQEHHCCPRYNRVIKEALKNVQPEKKMQCNFCSMSICTLEGRPCSRQVVKKND